MGPIDLQPPPSSVSLGPGAIPLLGHLPALVRDAARWLDACRRTAPVVEVRLGTRRVYLVCEPQLVHEMLIGQVTGFDKGGPMFEQAREIVGDGLITVRHAGHRRQRRLMQPAFSPAQIAGYTTEMQRESAALANSWQPHSQIDVLKAMHDLTLHVLVRTLLPTTDLSRSRSLAKQIRVLADGTGARIAIPFLSRLPTPGNWRFERARAAIRVAAGQAITAARAHDAPGSLLTALMGADSRGDTIDDDELVVQVFTLLVAGVETSSATLAWIFHTLAHHPDIEERLCAEIDTVLSRRPAGPADWPKLPFTRNVILETMRMHPPGWMFTRVSTREIQLGGHIFPAGTDFLFSPYQLHHDPDSFPDPERFNPDRWNTAPSQRARAAYVPFAAGRRKCIGDTFALAEITTTLTAILSLWHLRPVPGRCVQPRFRASHIPAELHMVTHPRSGTVHCCRQMTP